MATNSKIQSLDIPNWGMTMETGVVGEWLIGIGDSFKQGDPLVTVESTKIANDLEAPFDGTLRRIVADVGQELPVGDIIGVSADPDVSEEDIDAFVAKRQAEDAAKSGGGQEPQPAAAAPAPAKKEAAPSPQPSQPAPV
ncbi:MAG: diaminohydroxyphosphoribosylaminopyrimidine deaminase, partial [Corynebacterium flavescens]